jgi:hypothetical protein
MFDYQRVALDMAMGLEIKKHKNEPPVISSSQPPTFSERPEMQGTWSI